MSRRPKTPQDIIEQGLISSVSPTKFLKRLSSDRRTRASTQRAARELFSGRSASEVGEQIGISYQRATALRLGVEKGTIYSPEIRDYLKGNVQESEKPVQTKEGVWYFPDEKLLNKAYKTERIKGFADRQDAINWWQSIIGSEKYVVIARQKGKKEGQDFYQVLGLGSRAERPRTYKAQKSGKAYKRREKQGEMRLTQIRKKYEKSL